MEKINDYMTTRQEAFDWLAANKYLVYNSVKFGGPQLTNFFLAYNIITGEAKSVTGCGRCLLNMKHRLRSEIEKNEKDMTTYTVYLTTKGNYTFKETSKPIAYIRANSETAAKEQLEIMKKQAKANVQ